MQAQTKMEIRERPILFSGPMVKAILDGRKTQTRRVVKLPSWSTQDWDDFDPDEPSVICKTSGCMPDLPCPYGKPGDRLWVRESWVSWRWNNDVSPSEMTQRWGDMPARDYIGYPADNDITRPSSQGPLRMDGRPRPSIHMPRWASRITLEITNVRVERLHQITQADIHKEGGPDNHLAAVHLGTKDAEYLLDYGWFFNVWDKINGKKHPWESNPWVWVIEFRHDLNQKK